LTWRRQSEPDQRRLSDDDFDVVLVDTRETIGRIYARPTSGLTQLDWWCGFALPHSLRAKMPYYGLAGSKAAAKQAFADQWRLGGEAP
jgi:hypothetical protein